MRASSKSVWIGGSAAFAIAVGVPAAVAVTGSPSASAAMVAGQQSSSTTGVNVGLTGTFGACVRSSDGGYTVAFTVTNHTNQTVNSYANGYTDKIGVRWSAPYSVAPNGGTASGTIPFPASVAGQPVQVTVDYAWGGNPGGVDTAHWTTVQCPGSTPPPTSPPPSCTTLTWSNLHQYVATAEESKFVSSVSLKPGDYCNNLALNKSVWTNSGVQFPQTFASASAAVIGKSSLSATVTASAATACGQIDDYMGEPPAKGSVLTGPGQGYEATHPFWDSVMGTSGPSYWYLGTCSQPTPPPTSPPAPKTFTITWGNLVCKAGPDNDKVGSPTVSPKDAGTVNMGSWKNGKRTVSVKANDGYAPAKGTSLEKTYTDDGSNCGVSPTPPPPTGTPTGSPTPPPSSTPTTQPTSPTGSPTGKPTGTPKPTGTKTETPKPSASSTTSKGGGSTHTTRPAGGNPLTGSSAANTGGPEAPSGSNTGLLAGGAAFLVAIGLGGEGLRRRLRRR